MLIAITGPSSFTDKCIDMVENCLHANPILLYQNNKENIEETLQLCYGVILAGGWDIHPMLYCGQVNNYQGLSCFDLKRDAREVIVYKYCVMHKIPVLGICRGHQLIGALHEYPFIQDLKTEICHSPHRNGIETYPGLNIHQLENLTDYLGQDERIWTNSFHHQAIAYDPENKDFIIDVISEDDESIIELMHNDHVISCQWHPEYDWKENRHSRTVVDKFKEILNPSRFS